MQIWRPGDSEDSRVHKQHGIFGVASVWFGILEGDRGYKKLGKTVIASLIKYN